MNLPIIPTPIPLLTGVMAASTAVLAAVESSYNLKSIGLVITSVALTMLSGFFWRYRDKSNAREADQAKRLAILEGQMAIVTTQVSPLWAAVQAKISRDLTHPSTQFAEMDELLSKLGKLTITPEGRQRLDLLLAERILNTDPEITHEERESAKLMQGVMAKVVSDATKQEKENAEKEKEDRE